MLSDWYKAFLGGGGGTCCFTLLLGEDEVAAEDVEVVAGGAVCRCCGGGPLGGAVISTRGALGAAIRWLKSGKPACGAPLLASSTGDMFLDSALFIDVVVVSSWWWLWWVACVGASLLFSMGELGVFSGSSSANEPSDSGRWPCMLRELRRLCKLCRLCTERRSSRSSKVDLNARITRSCKHRQGTK